MKTKNNYQVTIRTDDMQIAGMAMVIVGVIGLIVCLWFAL